MQLCRQLEDAFYLKHLGLFSKARGEGFIRSCHFDVPGVERNICFATMDFFQSPVSPKIKMKLNTDVTLKQRGMETRADGRISVKIRPDYFFSDWRKKRKT